MFAAAILNAAPNPSVAIVGDDSSFTLANGMVAARVLKCSGDLTWLRYNGLELLDNSSGRPSGYWSQRELGFDASLMKTGDNVLKLTIPEGSLTSRVIYDYLRLELAEAAPPK